MDEYFPAKLELFFAMELTEIEKWTCTEWKEVIDECNGNEVIETIRKLGAVSIMSRIKYILTYENDEHSDTEVKLTYLYPLDIMVTNNLRNVVSDECNDSRWESQYHPFNEMAYRQKMQQSEYLFIITLFIYSI